MTFNKRKKNTRFRAKTTHGYGSMKKNRGAGHRGGRGNAGSGKRADVKKPCNWKDKKYFGKHGFKLPHNIQISGINLGDIEIRFESLLKSKLIQEKSGIYEIDLASIGYQKLLSSGSVTRKMKITALQSSKSAIEKIQKLGCEIVLQSVLPDKELNQQKED